MNNFKVGSIWHHTNGNDWVEIASVDTEEDKIIYFWKNKFTYDSNLKVTRTTQDFLRMFTFVATALPKVGDIWEADWEEDVYDVNILALIDGRVHYCYEIPNTPVGVCPMEYFMRNFSEKEESLPEIGEVMYLNSRGADEVTKLYAMDSKEYDQVLLITARSMYGTSSSAHLMKLDANDALALAADLTRMAMQLKRRIGE